MFQPIIGERQCTKCGVCKPLTEFKQYANKSFRPCNDCRREDGRNRYRKKTGAVGRWIPLPWEVEAIVKHYPEKGPGGCLRLVRAGATRSQMTRIARQQGVRCIPGATHRQREEAPWGVPTHTLAEQLDCVRLRNWRGPVMPGPLVGVIGRAMA